MATCDVVRRQQCDRKPRTAIERTMRHAVRSSLRKPNKAEYIRLDAGNSNTTVTSPSWLALNPRNPLMQIVRRTLRD